MAKKKETKKAPAKKKQAKEEPVQITVYSPPQRIECRKYLASKGVKPHHIDAMIVYAKCKGFTGKQTVPEWEKVFEGY